MTRKVLTIAAVLVAAVILLRALMPWAVAHYVNAQLAQIGEYRGHVASVDLALVRGAYELHNLEVVKQGSKAEPFLTLPHVDISLEWSAILDGELVGEIQLQNPVMNMIQGETAEESQLGAGVDWAEEVRKLFPYRFNRVEVRSGTATFRAPGIERNESLTLNRLNIVLSNLTNVEDRNEPTFAEFDVNGTFGKTAPLSITGHANPLAMQPTFDVNFSLDGAELVDVNPWLEEFLNVDAEQGAFSLYAELAAADGRFEGYIKPILQNAEIFRLEEPASSPLQKAWEALVGLVGGLLENPEKDQIATQIPYAGELQNPDAELLPAAVNLLRNAFVAAFTHALEGSVSLEDVESGEQE
jgi:hypothetical protein